MLCRRGRCFCPLDTGLSLHSPPSGFLGVSSANVSCSDRKARRGAMLHQLQLQCIGNATSDLVLRAATGTWIAGSPIALGDRATRLPTFWRLFSSVWRRSEGGEGGEVGGWKKRSSYASCDTTSPKLSRWSLRFRQSLGEYGVRLHAFRTWLRLSFTKR